MTSIRLLDLIAPSSTPQEVNEGGGGAAANALEINPACMRLALTALRRTEECFKGENYTALTGNPGDSQCQVRAAILLTLGTTCRDQILSEFAKLRHQLGLPDNPRSQTMTGIAAEVNRLICNDSKGDASQRVYTQLQEVTLSYEMSFLVQAFLSEATTQTIHNETISFRSEPDLLNKLEKKLIFRGCREQLISYQQTLLSKLTADLFELLKQRHQLEGSSYKKTFHFVASKGNHPNTTRTCTSAFHTTQTLFEMLCKSQGQICLADLNSKQRLYFQAPARAEETWTPTRANAFQEPTIVIQASFPQAPDAITQQLCRCSLATEIKRHAALMPPYHNISKLDELPQEAQKEILSYKNTHGKPTIPLRIHHFVVEKLRGGQHE